jgi:hypothetical protein
MRSATAAFLLVCFAGLITSCSSVTGQQPERISKFWNWFQTNQQLLSSTENPGDKAHVELGENLKSIEEGLTFEIGKATDEKREIAVSADGIPELFPLVKQVVAAAPKMEKWQVVAFRQRVPAAALKELAIRGGPAGGGGEQIDLAAKDMRGSISRAGDKANVAVFMKNYTGKEGQQNMVLVMLQQALGEYDLVTKVGDIRFASIEEDDKKNSVPFEELGSALDNAFATSRK